MLPPFLVDCWDGSMRVPTRTDCVPWGSELCSGSPVRGGRSPQKKKKKSHHDRRERERPNTGRALTPGGGQQSFLHSLNERKKERLEQEPLWRERKGTKAGNLFTAASCVVGIDRSHPFVWLPCRKEPQANVPRSRGLKRFLDDAKGR